MHPSCFWVTSLGALVAVPARGADCITMSPAAYEEFYELPSPRGVRIASAKGYKSV